MTQLLVASLSFLLVSIANPTLPQTSSATHDFNFLYNMNAPTTSLELEDVLEEISGLSLSKDEKFIIANNDELGTIYFLNKETATIEKEIEFHKEGDYEGIEAIDNRIFVVKSTGTIYEIEDIEAAEITMKKYKFFLTKDNDVEALGYDAKNNRMLLGCKGKSGEGEDFLRKKAIFAFDLNTMVLQETPVFLITLSDVCSYLGTCSLDGHVLENLHEFFDPNGEILNFSPSSIAVHPITGHLYITSSKGKMILVLNEMGKILHIEKLNKDIHPQPEGLCFEKDGTMWISNEAKKASPARVYRFEYLVN